MRRTKQWLATAAMLLSNAISVYAQIDFKEITFAVHDNQGPLFISDLWKGTARTNTYLTEMDSHS